MKTRKFLLADYYTFYLGFLLLFLSLSFTMSCEDDPVIEPTPEPATESTFQDVLLSMGMLNKLDDITRMNYQVKGSSYEYEEEEPSQANPLNTRNYNYGLTTEFLNRKLSMSYSSIESLYPFTFSTNGAEIKINNQQGTIEGAYDLTSIYFGQSGLIPLYTERIETIVKNYKMSNPIELIKNLSQTKELSSETIDNQFKIKTSVTGMDITLDVDLDTHLPTKASITEVDYLRGDVSFVVTYDNWAEVSGIKYPTKLTYTYNEQKLKEEEISSVFFEFMLPEDFFDLKETSNTIPHDPNRVDRGVYHTQWYDRFFNLGFPIDMPLNVGLVMKDQYVQAGIPDQTIGDNVKIIGRPDMQYWAVAIDTDDGVVIVDAPLNPEWASSIIRAVKGEGGFPNKDITAVIPTHTHVDHFGGIRELAAETGKVLVHSKGKEELQSVIDAKFVISPDRLATEGTNVVIEEINTVTSIGNNIEIHPISMTESASNPHAEDMLMVYVPEYELLIQADLFNAGLLVALYADQLAAPLSDETKATWNERAKFLLDYIIEKELKVSKIIGVHGGVSPIEHLQFLAS